jgi:hypothetical protein
LKNNHIVLFIVGIIIGGTLMFAVLVFLWISDNSISPQTIAFTSTADHSPRLIALEPTSVRPKATRTLIHPTATARPGSVPTQLTVSLTPTPLTLLRDQPPEIIGYSVEGRPLQVYTFGSGEQERMIVAGIHGGDEWNTVTLANQLIVHLNQNPEGVPKDVKLYILPNLNPDGNASQQIWTP